MILNMRQMKNSTLKIAVIVLSLVVFAIATIIVVIMGKRMREGNPADRKIYRQVVSVDAVNEDESITFATCYKNEFVVENNPDGTASMLVKQ